MRFDSQARFKMTQIFKMMQTNTQNRISQDSDLFRTMFIDVAVRVFHSRVSEYLNFEKSWKTYFLKCLFLYFCKYIFEKIITSMRLSDVLLYRP